jgi:hypothetical protein
MWQHRPILFKKREERGKKKISTTNTFGERKKRKSGAREKNVVRKRKSAKERNTQDIPTPSMNCEILEALLKVG